MEKCVSIRQNNLFKNNQSQLYKELGGATNNSANHTPNATEAREFWGKIWSVDKRHDRSASWLGEVRERFDDVGQQEKVVVTLEDVESRDKEDGELESAWA